MSKYSKNWTAGVPSDWDDIDEAEVEFFSDDCYSGPHWGGAAIAELKDNEEVMQNVGN